jgi:hypothetical protein
VLHQVIGPEMTHENITKGQGAPTLVEYLAPALEDAISAAGPLRPSEARTGNGVAHPIEVGDERVEVHHAASGNGVGVGSQAAGGLNGSETSARRGA